MLRKSARRAGRSAAAALVGLSLVQLQLLSVREAPPPAAAARARPCRGYPAVRDHRRRSSSAVPRRFFSSVSSRGGRGGDEAPGTAASTAPFRTASQATMPPPNSYVSAELMRIVATLGGLSSEGYQLRAYFRGQEALSLVDVVGLHHYLVFMARRAEGDQVYLRLDWGNDGVSLQRRGDLYFEGYFDKATLSRATRDFLRVRGDGLAHLSATLYDFAEEGRRYSLSDFNCQHFCAAIVRAVDGAIT